VLHPDFAEVAQLLLKELGYDVVHAVDVAAAREALARGTLEVVLTDVAMPGSTNGLDLAREVRQRGSPPVVLATATATRPRGG